MPKKPLGFKVVRDVKRKPKGRSMRPEYTLDCERRLESLKSDLNNMFDNNIEQLSSNFEDHYQKLSKTHRETLPRKNNSILNG